MRRVEIIGLVLIVGFVLGGRGIAQAPGPASEQTPRPASSQSGNAEQAPRLGSGQAGDVEQGKTLYVSYGCYQCHGYEAQGSSATGPRLGPRAIAFASFAKYVREPTGQMPPYTIKVASDADIADIYAFVLARPAAPPVESIPLLR